MRFLLLIAIATSPLLAEQQPWEIAAGGRMSFDVASVKPVDREAFHVPSFPLDSGEAFVPTGGRFSAVFPLRVYVQFAYKRPQASGETTTAFAGLPRWFTEQP